MCEVKVGSWYSDVVGNLHGPMQEHKNFVFPEGMVFSCESSVGLWFQDGTSVGLFNILNLVKEVIVAEVCHV